MSSSSFAFSSSRAAGSRVLDCRHWRNGADEGLTSRLELFVRRVATEDSSEQHRHSWPYSFQSTVMHDCVMADNALVPKQSGLARVHVCEVDNGKVSDRDVPSPRAQSLWAEGEGEIISDSGYVRARTHFGDSIQCRSKG